MTLMFDRVSTQGEFSCFCWPAGGNTQPREATLWLFCFTRRRQCSTSWGHFVYPRDFAIMILLIRPICLIIFIPWFDMNFLIVPYYLVVDPRCTIAEDTALKVTELEFAWFPPYPFECAQCPCYPFQCWLIPALSVCFFIRARLIRLDFAWCPPYPFEIARFPCYPFQFCLIPALSVWLFLSSHLIRWDFAWFPPYPFEFARFPCYSFQICLTPALSVWFFIWLWPEWEQRGTYIFEYTRIWGHARRNKSRYVSIPEVRWSTQNMCCLLALGEIPRKASSRCRKINSAVYIFLLLFCVLGVCIVLANIVICLMFLWFHTCMAAPKYRHVIDK